MAAREAGGRAKLAADLGVTVQAVGNWKLRGIPIEHCAGIESATGGKITRRHLRPDDWQKIWPELAVVPANQAQTATETVAQGV